jgi:hypothetical protein
VGHALAARLSQVILPILLPLERRKYTIDRIKPEMFPLTFLKLGQNL